MMPGHDEPELEHYAAICGACIRTIGQIYVKARPWRFPDFRSPDIAHGCFVPRDPRKYPPSFD